MMEPITTVLQGFLWPIGSRDREVVPTSTFILMTYDHENLVRGGKATVTNKIVIYYIINKLAYIAIYIHIYIYILYQIT